MEHPGSVGKKISTASSPQGLLGRGLGVLNRYNKVARAEMSRRCKILPHRHLLLNARKG